MKKAKSTSAAAMLRKGGACIACRSKKHVSLRQHQTQPLFYNLSLEFQKCDAGRPACGPCTRVGMSSFCEYDQHAGFSKTVWLQNRVKLLEGMVQREMEVLTTAGRLPAKGSSTDATRNVTQLVFSNASSPASAVISLSNTSSRRTSLISDPVSPLLSELGDPMAEWWNQDELPLNIRDYL